MATGGEPVRIGVIGTGAIAQVVHLPIFAEREDVDLVALADEDTHKAEALSRRFEVPLVMDTEELVEHEGLDALVVCTPNHLHESMAISGLEAGKHVFVERPLAMTAEGAARVVETAERVGRHVVVGMPHRARPGVAALRSFVEGGELGEVYAVHGGWMTRPLLTARSAWRRIPELAGGGVLFDLGIPALDLCMWLVDFPAVRRVSCVLRPADDGVEDAATLTAEIEGGVALTVEVSNLLFAGEDRYFTRVMGTEGTGSLPPLEVFKQLGGRPIEVTPRQPRPRGGEDAYTNAYRRLLDTFVRAVAGTVDVALPEEQVGLMALVEAAYESARSGREVEL